MEDKDFIGNKFLQKCGQYISVISKTDKKQSGRNPLFECVFDNGQKILCRKDHVLRGTVQNEEICKEHEDEFLNKEFKQNCGYILIPINKTIKKINGVYTYEGYFKNFEKYGNVYFLKVNAQKGRVDNPFLVWKNKKLFEQYLKDKKEKITIHEISKDLKISFSLIGQYIYKYNLFDYISYNSKNSEQEENLRNFIKSIYKGKIEKYCLKNSQEIDIYLPDLKLGFEYNGNYWHSELFRDKNYHLNKTLQAKKEDICLIHIWEYEYRENNIKDFIKNKINDKKYIFYGRKCEVKNITTLEYNEFCIKNHIQGKRGAKVKLGLFCKNELVQIMSFGVPRFTDKYEWELIRECTKYSCIVIGGEQKIFKYFLKNYSPKSIISYCDFSKFSGNSYLKLGFSLKIINNDFVWWDQKTNSIFWRNPYKNKELSEKCLKLWKVGQKSFVFEK